MKKNKKKMQKYLVNSKICCTFASAFAQKWGTPQEPKQMIFEKMSIHNKIVVQELNNDFRLSIFELESFP